MIGFIWGGQFWLCRHLHGVNETSRRVSELSEWPRRGVCMGRGEHGSWGVSYPPLGSERHPPSSSRLPLDPKDDLRRAAW